MNFKSRNAFEKPFVVGRTGRTTDLCVQYNNRTARKQNDAPSLRLRFTSTAAVLSANPTAYFCTERIVRVYNTQALTIEYSSVG